MRFIFYLSFWAARRHVVPRGKSKCGECASCAQPRLRLGCLNPTQSTPKKSELQQLKNQSQVAHLQAELQQLKNQSQVAPALSTHQSSTCLKNRRCSIQSTNRKWPTYKLSFSS